MQAQAKKEDVQVVIFRLDKEEFGIEINQVKEVVPLVEITRIPAAPSHIVGIINLRGQVIPIVDLASQFGLIKHDQFSKKARIVVIDLVDNIVGIIVDEVPDVLKISKEKIEPTPDFLKQKIKTPYITSVAKLNDRIILLLDIGKIIFLPTEAVSELISNIEGTEHG